MLPLESVPNVSEGRDRVAIRAIVEGFERDGAHVLDLHSDVDHHRSVLTLVGDTDEGLVEALVSGVVRARDRIDLTSHAGVHPRVGAADVVPLVPLAPGDEARAIAAAHAVGRRVGDELELPVFLYGIVGEGRRPAFFRRGGTVELERRMVAGEATPAYGPPRLHPTAGAVLVGARAPLVAFNLVLERASVEVAREIAAEIRGSTGGMPGVQALGLQLRDGRSQVSLNLVDLEVAPLDHVVEQVRQEAERHGAAVACGELVGLLPARVVGEAANRAGVETVAGDDGLPTAVALAAAAAAFALPELRPDRLIESHLLSMVPRRLSRA